MPRDEDALYVKDNGALVNVANGSGIADQIVSAKLTWEVTITDGEWTFNGPGTGYGLKSPTIYVMRGQRYKFINKTDEETPTPFVITTTNGTPYNVGVTGNPAEEADDFIEWNVSMQAPQNLRYNNGAGTAEGKFIVLSDTFTLDAGDLDNVDTDGVEDGNVLVWSDSQQQWRPANLTTGGTTNLGGLTDVNITGVTQEDVLKYNGEFWVAAPEASDPGSAGRKSTVAISDTRSGQMAGTEFILADDTVWDGLGFQRLTTATGRGPDEWITLTIGFTENWSPLGRNDSRADEGKMYFDGSGRFIGFTNDPANLVSVSSTKYLSVPQNCALSMIAFLKASNQTIHRAGYKSNHQYQGQTWWVLRVEYAQGSDKMPVEFWLSSSGSMKIMYGSKDPGFTYSVGPNKNGLVFASRTDDTTLGEANTNLPYQDDQGDYAVEFWYNGAGYNLDDLANVADSNEYPPSQNVPLVWEGGSWKPGSIVRDGSQASTSGGNIGLFAVDNVYLYVCVGENEWKRIVLEAFA